MKKFLFSFLMLVLWSMGNSVAHAEGTNTGQIKVNVEVSTNQVSLDWSDAADSYKIYLKDSLIWEGEKSQFIHKDLKANFPYNYTIETYNNSKLADSVEVRTKTSQPDIHQYSQLIDEEMQPWVDNAFIDAVVNNESVELDLRGHVEDNLDNSLELYKDGSLIEKENTGEYTDTNIKPGDIYVYKFVAKNKIPKDKIQIVKSQLEAEGIDHLTQEEEETYFYAPYEYIKVVKIPENNKESMAYSNTPPAQPAPNQTGFKYRTFIPSEFAPAASIVEGVTEGYQFGGDDRGFSFSGGTHRTQTDVVVRFTENSSSSFFNQDIMNTTLYDKNGNYISSKAPSDASIRFEKGIQQADTNFVRIKHTAQVAYTSFPNWIIPNIDYTLGITTHSQDSWSLSGTRDQAPSHELYWYIPYSDVMFDLIQAPNLGFEYLIPALPNATINISM